MRSRADRYHCDDCDVCIDGHDHHCPWIDNCVGANNHGVFLCFIISMELFCLGTIVLDIYFITGSFQEGSLRLPGSNYLHLSMLNFN